ncbi:MAG: putative rane-associated protein [Actinomycetia bacterium]|jgi:membrane-associated protein|nr:putative rane-associated protein [Actinomycetes bacterium]
MVSKVPFLTVATNFLNPTELIHWFGPWATIGLFLIVFAESGLLVGFFLPGDSLLFTAGLLAAKGDSGLKWPVLAIGCAFFAVAGWQIGYMIGKRIGPSLFHRPDSRLFKQEHVQRTKAFFDHHGPKTILIARFVPIVRTFAPILAGVGEMRYRSFARYNIIGGVAWGAGVVIAGTVLGKTVPHIDKYLLPIVGLIIVASVVPPLLEVRRHRKAAPLSVGDAEAAADDLEHRVNEEQ